MSTLSVLPTPKRTFFTGRWLETMTTAGGLAVEVNGIDLQRLSTVLGPCHVSSQPQVTVRVYRSLDDAAREALSEGKLPPNWLEWEREGYLLTIHSADGVPVITIAAQDKRGEHYALQTLGQMIQRSGQTTRLPVVQLADWPDFAQRGVIEGFYGHPWSHRERLSMIEFCGQNKLNIFFYAPKDDPYHRAQWREPYPASKLAELVELIDACREHQVDFVFSVSPGNGMRFGGEEDFALLAAKIGALFDHGVRHFSLLLDDIDPRLASAEDRAQFGSAAAAQAYLANHLLEYLRAKDPTCSLSLCPTEYSENEPSSYRTGLAEHLRPEIPVIWTGVGVVAPTISGADADRIAGYFGHDLLLWDNYPVNDYAPYNLFLGPIRNREPELHRHRHVGVVSNPMNQPEASKIALFSYADYLWSSAAYRPDDNWREAVRRLGGEQAYPHLWEFCQYAQAPRLWQVEGAELRRLMDDFWAQYATEAQSDDGELVVKLESLVLLPNRLRSTLANPALLAEVEPWFAKLSDEANMVLLTLTLLRELRQHPARELWARRVEIEQARQQLVRDPYQIGGSLFTDFVEHALASLPEELQFQPVGAVVSTTFPEIPAPRAVAFTNLSVDPEHPLAAMLDHDTATYFLGKHADGVDPAIRPGDHVGIDLGDLYEVSRLHVSMTEHTPGKGTHFLRQVACEGSVDGENWQMLIGRPSWPELVTRFTPRRLRYLRMVSTLDQDDPLAVREFRVNADSPEIPPERAAFAPVKVIDGNRQSYFLSRGAVEAGQSLTLDLGEEKRISRVTLLQHGVNHLTKAVIEASADGEQWAEVATIDRSAATLPWQGSARYLRLRALIGGSATQIYLFYPHIE